MPQRGGRGGSDEGSCRDGGPTASGTAGATTGSLRAAGLSGARSDWPVPSSVPAWDRSPKPSLERAPRPLHRSPARDFARLADPSTPVIRRRRDSVAGRADVDIERAGLAAGASRLRTVLAQLVAEPGLIGTAAGRMVGQTNGFDLSARRAARGETKKERRGRPEVPSRRPTHDAGACTPYDARASEIRDARRRGRR